MLSRNRAEGRLLLQNSISSAAKLPPWDVHARNALMDAYEELIFDAARSSDYLTMLKTDP